MTTEHDQSCWFTDDSELHPESACASRWDLLAVATNGKRRWISCETCGKTWDVSEDGKIKEAQ